MNHVGVCKGEWNDETTWGACKGEWNDEPRGGYVWVSGMMKHVGGMQG